MLTSEEYRKSQMVKETRFDIRLKHWIAGILPSDGEIRSGNGSVMMDDRLMHQRNYVKERWVRGEVSYPWWRAGHGACMSLPGGDPGESGWSFSQAGAPGTP